jgi:hypothetical protein
MTRQVTVAKYLSACRDTVSCVRSLMVVKTGERLRSLGFPLKVGVGNDAPTFNTTDLAGPVFLLRNGIGNQAAVRTGVGRAFRERGWGLSWSFDFHDVAL